MYPLKGIMKIKWNERFGHAVQCKYFIEFISSIEGEKPDTITQFVKS